MVDWDSIKAKVKEELFSQYWLWTGQGMRPKLKAEVEKGRIEQALKKGWIKLGQDLKGQPVDIDLLKRHRTELDEPYKTILAKYEEEIEKNKR